jgi:hypothetical protein
MITTGICSEAAFKAAFLLARKPNLSIYRRRRPRFREGYARLLCGRKQIERDARCANCIPSRRITGRERKSFGFEGDLSTIEDLLKLAMC